MRATDESGRCDEEPDRALGRRPYHRPACPQVAKQGIVSRHWASYASAAAAGGWPAALPDLQAIAVGRFRRRRADEHHFPGIDAGILPAVVSFPLVACRGDALCGHRHCGRPHPAARDPLASPSVGDGIPRRPDHRTLIDDLRRSTGRRTLLLYSTILRLAKTVRTCKQQSDRLGSWEI